MNDLRCLTYGFLQVNFRFGVELVTLEDKFFFGRVSGSDENSC